MERTLKREVAIFLIAWLLGLATYTFFEGGPEQKLQVLGMFMLPVFGFVAAAFGMDWLSKQTDWGGPPKGGDR